MRYLFEQLKRHRTSGDVTKQRLADELHCGLTKSNFPEDEREYWTRQGKCRPELIDYVVKEAKKLFFLSVMCFHRDADAGRVLKAMQFFRAKGYRDGEEPTKFTIPNTETYGPKIGVLDINTLRATDRDFWDFATAGEFCTKQWQVLVPVLSTEKPIYDLAGKVILPFTRVGWGAIATSASSKVYRVKIEAGHFQDPYRKRIFPPGDARASFAAVFANEALRLRNMNDNDHVTRFITSIITGNDQASKSYYLIFDWADGGSLEDLFLKHPDPVLTAKIVKASVTQLKGLADALYATHQKDIRHGDLKPSNILRFNATNEDVIGNLKLGDWGLAKYHSVATDVRRDKGIHTTTKYGTALYEPPEVEDGDVTLLSRQYDIWSLGVIMLELMVWLLYGKGGVKQFREDIQGPSKSSKARTSCYEVVEANETDGSRFGLCTPVVKWMDHLASLSIFGKDTALGTLLAFVRNRLLVVHVIQISPGMDPLAQEDFSTETASQSSPQTLVSGLPGVTITAPSGEGQPRQPGNRRYISGRADSKELADKLNSLISNTCSNEGWSDSYWPRSEWKPRKPSTFSTLDYHWERHSDDAFAAKALSRLQQLPTTPNLPLPRLPSSTKLCSSCENLEFLDPLGLTVEYIPSELQKLAMNCDLCSLLWNMAQKYEGTGPGIPKIRFERVESWLKMEGSDHPVLSICHSHEPTNSSRPEIQLGIVNLPTPGSQPHFETIRQWLQLCDDQRRDCHVADRHFKPMPTRVIDVGKNDDPSVHLWEPGPDRHYDYIALSHPWGQGRHFVTDIENLERHKQRIDLDELPATFRDAVLATRALNKRYLWIDSICIIQGVGGDFHTECEKMEAVFSSAYCVLAASRARSQEDGFLTRSQEERQYVTLRDKKQGGRIFYLCENIDNFELHVLNSHLHRRGWVLQEHALARRTVFFTEAQTYFECGDGVRCETLTKMSNNLAAFVGDPHFPRIIMGVSLGERIIRLQNLFKTYLGLHFTNNFDRPVAVIGMQNRLLDTLDTSGGYGILGQDDDDYAEMDNAITRAETNYGQRSLLRHNLLWNRRCEEHKGAEKHVSPTTAEAGLEPIDFPEDHNGAPSWSWMAYIGEIDYFRELNGLFVFVPWCQPAARWNSVSKKGLFR
ncbi:Serine/threonine-protein kinase par-4 [Triangularia verruculosa]|uniref:Serine/threonine-protein kinase par-4 n=1 Tax=Triangularia verruculosa TaxID=2587418 RepID=A0AAN6XIB5_9PEZI|nr:Serine/threonine-protein kinase par-4 [Triangularia verruculosa]